MYGSRNNQTNVRTKSRVTKRAEHEVESSNAYSYNSDEETDDDAKNPQYTKEGKTKNQGDVEPLKCLGPGLYG